MIGSAAKKAEPANVKVVPDLARRLAKFRPCRCLSPAGLTVKERKMVGKLVEACPIWKTSTGARAIPRRLPCISRSGQQESA